MERHLVINTEENDLEYVIQVNDTDKGTEYVLSRSGSGCWTEQCRHEVVLTLLDDGNGVRVTPKIGKQLDYAQLSQLQLLLQFISKHEDSKKYQYKVVPEKDGFELIV